MLLKWQSIFIGVIRIDSVIKSRKPINKFVNQVFQSNTTITLM